jgi:hypothetical protein
MGFWWPNREHTKKLRPIETAQRFSMARSQITPAHPGSYFMTGPLELCKSPSKVQEMAFQGHAPEPP